MITMCVLGFAHDEATDSPVLVLQETDGETVLPIWIGQAEAQAISLAAGENAPPRPMAHDLLLQAVAALGGRVTSFSVTSIIDGVFIGGLDVLCERTDTLHTLDCRPSDGVAVALRAQIPILVDDTVMQAAAQHRRRSERTGDAPGQSAHIRMPEPQTVLPSACVQEDSGQTNELLRSLEPVSKRVM